MTNPMERREMNDEEWLDDLHKRHIYYGEPRDWYAYNKEILARLREARLDSQHRLIEAIIDLFINPPEGAAEDTHYHPHQIRDMLSAITDDMLAELHPSQRLAEKEKG